jgi:3-dehydroquinate dehydratase-2
LTVQIPFLDPFSAKAVMAKTIYVLNGPNLNLLGLRQPEIYGTATLKDVEALCREAAKPHGFEIDFRQSNREGELVDFIHDAYFKKASGIIINPAGYTTTSIAILDAIYSVKLPVVEIHISNIHQREEFRHHSFVSKGAKGVICGFGIFGYTMAINGLVELIKTAKD